MCTYNTNFKVKYQHIEDELLEKCRTDLECGYNVADILDICHKLYRDELLSVFNIDNMLVEDVNQQLSDGVERLIPVLSTNQKFMEIMEDIIQCNLKQLQNTDDNEKTYDCKYLFQTMFINLFSQDMFYLTHTCICQHINSGVIEDELLEKIRQKSLEAFHL